MRVALFPADGDGCGIYRCRQPAAAAHSEGVEIMFPHDLASREERAKAFESDVVVFQRPANRMIANAIPGLQQRGIAVVIDIDDDLAALDPRHPAFMGLHPRSDPAVNWQHIRQACKLADLVTVSTPALAERYGFGHARVIPNYVAASWLDTTGERDGRTVGWAGNTLSHVDDLATTGGGVARGLEDTGARFLLVGKTPEDTRRQLALPALPDTTGYVPFDEYPGQVARFDIGIAPLRDTLFNRCKSALKGLEYAALGVPFVASPLADYQRIQADGIGVLAGRPRDWRRELRQLLTNPQARLELAAAGRQAVRERHTMEANGWRWAEAWADATAGRSLSRAA